MGKSWRGNPDLDTVALDKRDRLWLKILLFVLAIILGAGLL